MPFSLPNRLMLALTALVAAGLPACIGDQELPTQPSFYRNLATTEAQLDPAAAVSMISGFRRNNGLDPLTIDPELSKLAQQQAQAMASRDKLGHDVAGPFNERLRKGGYKAGQAAENFSAGYPTLAEAFSGWRDSPPHRANMLLRNATRLGIPAVRAPGS